MKVYIVEFGCYDESHIVGVYASVAKAMAAYPVREPKTKGERAGGWLQYRDSKGELCEEWNNGLDWADAGLITGYDVQS